LFVGELASGAREIAQNNEAREIGVRPCGAAPTAVASRSHLTKETEAFISENKISDCVNAGSSLKFCLVAAGEADIYPRFGPTMEWDTAAGHAVLAAAGGRVLTCDGSPLSYGKSQFRNPYFIAASPTAQYTIPATMQAM
jgi:3'(2'), 5'-bisphosphate nucleotidase